MSKFSILDIILIFSIPDIAFLFPPDIDSVSLELLGSRKVEEGQAVQMFCDVVAKPNPDKISWTLKVIITAIRVAWLWALVKLLEHHSSTVMRVLRGASIMPTLRHSSTVSNSLRGAPLKPLEHHSSAVLRSLGGASIVPPPPPCREVWASRMNTIPVYDDKYPRKKSQNRQISPKKIPKSTNIPKKNPKSTYIPQKNPKIDQYPQKKKSQNRHV